MKLFALLALCSIAEASPPPERQWFAGDVHMHVSPPDDPDDVQMSPAQIAAAARDNHLDFVVLTPHLWPGRWAKPNRERFQREWRQLAAAAQAERGVTLIPGVEWSTGDGHFTVTGTDIAALDRDDFLAAAHAAGAFISVNHPFAVPTRIGHIRASHFDMSYRVWTTGAKGFTRIDGVEVWNVPLGLANLISRPGGRTGEERAWTEANRVVHAEHRPLSAVAGTDNHMRNVTATTWVLATDTSPAAILAALRAGATCVGGTDAGSLKIRGDGRDWKRIGEAVTGKTVTLQWDGKARLFVDDVDRGEHDGGFVHDTGGTTHTYRLVAGTSRCGFVYANL
jgi:hypothetical protein